MKKIYFTITALLILSTTQISFAQSGRDGNITWSITNDTLTISGTGAMRSYAPTIAGVTTAPWYIHRNSFSVVVIENGVTVIERFAFWNLARLISVTIPNSVTSIRNSAFSRCTGLTSITIPNSVSHIGEGVFSYCTGLTSINVATDNSFFSSLDGVLFNRNLTTLITYPAGKQGAYTVPNSVTTIQTEAFMGSIGLTSITIPNSVITIGEWAFFGCSGLTSVTIGIGLTSIGHRALWDCSGLTSIDVATENHNFSSVNGVLFNKNQTTLIQYPGGRQGAYIIPNNVTTIGSGAFFRCTGLTSVTIPNSVITIGGAAFSGCTGLTSVIIPNSVTTIGTDAFFGCTGLISVIIGSGVTSIENYAFNQSMNLTSIVFMSTIPPAIGWDVFGLPPTMCFYVPAGSIDVYRGWTLWSCIKARPIYTVPFNSMGGSSVDSQTVNHGEKIIEPIKPTLADHTFMGWYKEETHINRWNFETDAVISDITLYAKWAFVPVANITNVSPTVTVGVPFSLTGLGTVEPNNATFQSIAWSVQNAGTTSAVIIGNNLFATANGLIILVATVENGKAMGTDYTQGFFVTVGDIVDIQALYDSIDNLNQQLTTCNNQNNMLTDSIGNLQQQLTTCNSQNNMLNDSIGNLQQQLTTCSSQNNMLNDSIGKLHLIIVEWIGITEDLLDTITWLRQTLVDCQNSGAANTATIPENHIPFYPNPATSQLHIINHNFRQGDVIELFDMAGRRVFSEHVNSHIGTFTIDMSPYQSGNYILRIGDRVAKVVKK